MKSICLFFVLAVFTASAFAQPPDTLWTKTYSDSVNLKCANAIKTSDGGYALIGTAKYGAMQFGQIAAIKTDSNGAVQWQRRYGTMGNDQGLSIAQLSDSGYLVAGATGISPWRHGVVSRLNANGDQLWIQTVSEINASEIKHAAFTADGGVAFTGKVESHSGDVFLAKADGNGTFEWSHTYGGAYYDCAFWVLQTNDLGYIVPG
jgi:hypothetical protein